MTPSSRNSRSVRLSSYSARLTVNATPSWSFSARYGRLENPERAGPAEDVHRIVASAMHGLALGEEGQWATALVYGRNEEGDHDPSHSVLLETEAVWATAAFPCSANERAHRTTSRWAIHPSASCFDQQHNEWPASGRIRGRRVTFELSLPEGAAA